jgi:hypothetical protein
MPRRLRQHKTLKATTLYSLYEIGIFMQFFSVQPCQENRQVSGSATAWDDSPPNHTAPAPRLVKRTIGRQASLLAVLLCSDTSII